MNEFISQEEINRLLSGELLPEMEIEESDRKKSVARLHNWYIEKVEWDDGKEGYVARGNVTGHYRLIDTSFIRTSEIISARVDLDAAEAVIETHNTEYHCRLSECDYAKEDTYDMIPKLADFSKTYAKEEQYETEDNSILIVLSDHEEYYFKTAIVKEGGKVYEGEMSPHIGSFQDSCLLSFEEYDKSNNYEKRIDIRYFPHVAHLETYCWETAGMQVYLENAGDGVICYTTVEGIIELKPGERKKVCKENALSEKNKLLLNHGDLYPAMFLN